MFTTGAFAFSQYLFGGGLNSIPDARDHDITLMNQRAQLYFLSQLTKKFSFYPQNLGSEWVRDLLNLYKHCRGGVGLKS